MLGRHNNTRESNPQPEAVQEEIALAAGLQPIAFLLLLNQTLGELESLLEVQDAVLQLMDNRLQVAFEVVLALGIPSGEPVGHPEVGEMFGDLENGLYTIRHNHAH